MNEQIQEQALRWHAATSRDDCDWQAFTEWLEASPQHRQAYDDVALLEERIVRHGQTAARDLEPAVIAVRLQQRQRLRVWIGMAVAACALVVLLAAEPLRSLVTGGQQTFTAQVGASRTLFLDGGIQVVLASGSVLHVAGRHDERMRLDGSAWFDAPHDPKRPLTIQAGPYQVRDIGTRFEVVSNSGELKVAVTEGNVGVMLPGSTQPVPVNAGQHLLVAGNPAIAEYGEVAAEDVAGWRTGRLVFRNEPLSMVASQLGRHAGLTVTVDPSIAQRRFSGVLAIGDGSQLVAELGQIMGLEAHRTGAVVHLIAAGDKPAGR